MSTRATTMSARATQFANMLVASNADDALRAAGLEQFAPHILCVVEIPSFPARLVFFKDESCLFAQKENDAQHLIALSDPNNLADFILYLATTSPDLALSITEAIAAEASK